MKYVDYETAMVQQVTIMIRTKHPDPVAFNFVKFTVDELVCRDLSISIEDAKRLMDVENMLQAYLEFLKYDRRLGYERK